MRNLTIHLMCVLASSLLFSCKKESIEVGEKLQGKVIIIGAGAAGLYAANLLKDAGKEFLILEAQDHYGGRLGELTDFADYPLDLGAQWLHGNNNLAYFFAESGKHNHQEDESEISYYFNDQITSAVPKNLDLFEGKYKPDISYWDYAMKEGLGEEYRYIIEGIAGDQGAAATRLSVKYNYEEEKNWNSGDQDYKFAQSYFEVIKNAFAEQVASKIRLNSIVTNIDYAGNQVIVKTSSDSTYYGEKVLVTVPISVLQDGDINFRPALPAEKTKAFQQIGMDAGIKVFLKFSSKFYKANVIGGKTCAAYIDESVGKKGTDHVLLAFVMGTQAEALSVLGSDDAIAGALLSELDEMYQGAASNSFIAAHVQNWGTNPFIKGAYSYSKVGMNKDTRWQAAQPVADKVYFAGEAMCLSGEHQTVQGALLSAYQQVVALMGE